MSYCHWPMSVVRRQQFALNNISETARYRALIFNIEHCLIDLYKVCSNGGPGVQNGPAAGIVGLKMKYTSKASSPELLGSGAWNLVRSISWWFFTKSVQTKVTDFKMAPCQGVLGSNHRSA